MAVIGTHEAALYYFGPILRAYLSTSLLAGLASHVTKGISRDYPETAFWLPLLMRALFFLAKSSLEVVSVTL
jgi:hypothetical protein